jgi:hypothetical protein
MSDQRYMQRGVSASKEDVHKAILNIDKGLFPKAFCKIIPDILGGEPEYCNICTLPAPVQSPHWPICTGGKPAICQFGKALPKML